jgi:hypothetical protein
VAISSSDRLPHSFFYTTGSWYAVDARTVLQWMSLVLETGEVSHNLLICSACVICHGDVKKVCTTPLAVHCRFCASVQAHGIPSWSSRRERRCYNSLEWQPENGEKMISAPNIGAWRSAKLLGSGSQTGAQETPPSQSAFTCFPHSTFLAPASCDVMWAGPLHVFTEFLSLSLSDMERLRDNVISGIETFLTREGRPKNRSDAVWFLAYCVTYFFLVRTYLTDLLLAECPQHTHTQIECSLNSPVSKHSTHYCMLMP